MFSQKINQESEAIELVPNSSAPSTVSELVQAISSTEPRFTFWRFTHTHGGTEASPVLFFYTCPAQAGMKSIKQRMLYPLSKKAVITVAEQESGIKVEKKFEVDEPSEITDESVMSELHPKVEVKTGFRRPKRPGR
jgi:twinfilin